MASLTRVGIERRKEQIKANQKLESHQHQSSGRSSKELHKNSNGHQHLCCRAPQENLINGAKGREQGTATGTRVKKVEFASQLEAEGGDDKDINSQKTKKNNKQNKQKVNKITT